jgi:hypothetical protein
MEEDDRLAVRIAAQLPIEAMAIADIEMAALVRLDRRVKRAAFLGDHVHQKLISE